MPKIKIYILLSLFFLVACSVTKKTANISRNIERDIYSLSDIVKNNISGHNFIIQKAEILISEKDVSTRFLATVKYRYPDSLLVSLRSKIGYEAARILLTKDTILISDRINKKIIVGKPADLKVKYGVEPSMIFIVLGDLIINEEDEVFKVTCNDGLYSRSFFVSEREIKYTVDCREGKAINTELFGDVRSGNINLLFTDFKKIGKFIVPGSIDIKNDINEMEIKIKVDKIESEFSGSIGYRIPVNYKKISLK